MGRLVFKDYPDFTPNLSPKQMFEKGIFGGTYFRPIYSSVVGKNLKNKHKKYRFLKRIPDYKICQSEYDVSVNKYGVKCGTSLEYWEDSGWITKYDPYGWVQWYCEFYSGRRCPDDERQVKRWKQFIQRFRNMKLTPKIMQNFLHWAVDVKK